MVTAFKGSLETTIFSPFVEALGVFYRQTLGWQVQGGVNVINKQES